MRKSISKGLKNKKDELGQFNTNKDLTDELCLSISVPKNSIVIEPSFGTGNFLNSIKKHIKDIKKIVGVEIDSEVYQIIEGVETYNKNFYDFQIDNINSNDYYVFIGNPPYRTPAGSLKTHKNLIDDIFNLYDIKGIKEEAVIFILYTYYLLKKNNLNGECHYILPKTIFLNPTKLFKTFYSFLRKNFKIISIKDVDSKNFDGVSQDLVFVSLKMIDNNTENYYFDYNEDKVSFDEFIGADKEVISYKDIFVKTYLGSVPAESFLLSCKGEPIESFQKRMENLFDPETNVTHSNLISLLSFNGKPHLQALKNENKEKIDTVLGYILEIKENTEIDKNIFCDIQNYKSIVHRKEIRYYFRHESLKKVSFVYIINSNPCKSFYFTSNPNKISTDYFGYCDYDVNRNSSPGGLRTVPIDNIEDNLKPNFKKWWNENSSLPYDKIFEYLIHISKSDWYKTQKNKYNKMYFGIPKKFDDTFNK